jgi:hypothetical protein
MQKQRHCALGNAPLGIALLVVSGSTTNVIYILYTLYAGVIRLYQPHGGLHHVYEVIHGQKGSPIASAQSEAHLGLPKNRATLW